MTIAHQFYNALDRFMEYRRYRLTLGSSAGQAPIDVEASSDGTGDPAVSAESEGATSKEQHSWQQGNADTRVQQEARG